MEIRAAIVNHCRADATLVTLLGTSAQISKRFKRGTALPQLYFSPAGGEDVAAAAGTTRISVLVMAANETVCSQVHDRIRQLFHEKSNYTLGAASLTVFCNRSMRVSLPDELEYEEPAGVEWQAFYEFVTAQPHGF